MYGPTLTNVGVLMNLPMFPPEDSPGSSFAELLKRLGQTLPVPESGMNPALNTHATTIVAATYADGVLMASDRRATRGHSISDRTIEKVHPADHYSGISISGSAAFGMEMIRTFQLTLEHYEKIEGKHLSMEGKANQLSGLIRSNLGMAMQGFAVAPIFAGFDLNRGVGRIFAYDVLGGRSEKDDFHADGSGSITAGPVIKVGWKPGMTKEEVIELAVSGPYEAADDDSATGGPDVVRGIYPMVATITSEGYKRVPDDEVATRFNALIARKSEQGHRP
jgi:proteasome beta subunit